MEIPPINKLNNLRSGLPEPGTGSVVVRPLKAPLRNLSKGDLDVLQLTYNHSVFSTVLNRSNHHKSRHGEGCVQADRWRLSASRVTKDGVILEVRAELDVPGETGRQPRGISSSGSPASRSP